MKMTSRSRISGLVSCAVVVGFVAGGVLAQDYPAKPIRLIVPYSAGGSTDTIARVIGAKLGEILRQQVVIDNRTGADGRIGTEAAAKAAPDGYTILQVSNFHSIAPSAYRKLPYGAVKDFAAIALTSSSPNLLVVHPSVPARSMAELVKLAKSSPGKITCGTAGYAQTPHINLEILKVMAGIDITLVPFRGGSAAIIALLGGHTDMAFTSIVEAAPRAKAGKLRALGITSAKRSALVPDVPTMVESGFPGYINVTWQGVLAPAGTPKQIVATLNTAIVKVLKMPDVVERLSKLGMEPAASNTPEEFAAYIKTEIVRLGKVMKDAGMQPR